MTFKKAEMAKALRKGLSMSETDPLNVYVLHLTHRDSYLLHLLLHLRIFRSYLRFKRALTQRRVDAKGIEFTS